MPLPRLETEQWTEAQRRVAETIAAGPRGAVGGPFLPLLHSPELAMRLQAVGEYLRYGGELPRALNEMAILVTARFWTAQFEWYVHRPLAVKAGLPESVADAIAAGKRPASMSAAEAAVYDFCTELHRDHQVSEATLEAALALFGTQAVVELIGVCGYYTTLAMILNVSAIPLPNGTPDPLSKS